MFSHLKNYVIKNKPRILDFINHTIQFYRFQATTFKWIILYWQNTFSRKIPFEMVLTIEKVNHYIKYIKNNYVIFNDKVLIRKDFCYYCLKVHGYIFLLLRKKIGSVFDWTILRVTNVVTPIYMSRNIPKIL